MISFSPKKIIDPNIDFTRYKYPSYPKGSTLKALSRRRKLNGRWLYDDKEGEELGYGKYDTFGRKHKDWWYNKHEIAY